MRPCRIVSALVSAAARLGTLIEELAPAWLAQHESRLRARRGHDRLRAQGAGPHHDLPFADRVVATLVILRFQLPPAALAVFYGVHWATITRAVHEIRPLLAARGFAVPGTAGLRLRTPAPKKPAKDAPPEETARWEQHRHQQSSARICVEHAIAEPKQCRPLQRNLGRRDSFQETALAIAGLVADRAAMR